MDSAISSVLAARDVSVSDQVGMTVLRKAMDVQKEEGAQMVQMIQAAGSPGQGSQAGQLDLYA
jgi:Putative motility protein